MKKRILHIVEAFGGGIFSFLVDLVNSTSDEYEIIVAYGKREQTPDEFKNYFNNNVKFIEVKNFTRSINIVKDFKSFFEIKKIIKDINPDIIHLHSSKAGFLGRFASNSKVKVLYNPHGFSFLMKDSSKIKRLVYWIIEKISTIKKSKIVACSQGEYEESLKLSQNSICINNGINVENLNKDMEQIKEKDFDFDNIKICTSGRIGYQKNPELFNKIAEIFPNIQFTWIGDGELKYKLKSSNICITGWKTRKEVLELVNENDVFILTSLWEGLPISLLEAMYLKKICIVTDCIGNKDVVINERNGFIAKDEKDFERVIKAILSNQYDIGKIINTQCEDINNKYNTAVMVKKYKKEYR